MNEVLKDLPFAIAYLDDIIIYSKTATEHWPSTASFPQTLCRVGSLYLPFGDMPRNERNINNSWKGIGFIAPILHQSCDLAT